MIQVALRGETVHVRWEGQTELSFCASLPARRVLRDTGYSLKGWWWCAFQEALERKRIERANPRQDFEEIWARIKPA